MPSARSVPAPDTTDLDDLEPLARHLKQRARQFVTVTGLLDMTEAACMVTGSSIADLDRFLDAAAAAGARCLFVEVDRAAGVRAAAVDALRRAAAADSDDADVGEVRDALGAALAAAGDGPGQVEVAWPVDGVLVAFDARCRWFDDLIDAVGDAEGVLRRAGGGSGTWSYGSWRPPADAAERAEVITEIGRDWAFTIGRNHAVRRPVAAAASERFAAWDSAVANDGRLGQWLSALLAEAEAYARERTAPAIEADCAARARGLLAGGRSRAAAAEDLQISERRLGILLERYPADR